MPYQIQYGHSEMKTEIKRQSRRKGETGWKVLAVIIVLFVIYVLNTQKVQEYLVPGDNEITKQAFIQLDQSLREGQPFQAAFYDFCREIVQKNDIS